MVADSGRKLIVGHFRRVFGHSVYRGETGDFKHKGSAP